MFDGISPRTQPFMKTDTEILNEMAKKSSFLRLLSEEECALLKRTLLQMHNDLVALCDKLHLAIMLGGGSCLGAIRHHGYIPWDDDLDLMMPRGDYEKLIKAYEDGHVEGKYLFVYPNKAEDVKNTFLKICLKGTTCKEIFDDDDSFPTHVCIDVFPMDYAPDNVFLRRIKGCLSDFLQAVCTCTLYSQHRSKNMEAFVKQDEAAGKRYKLRLGIGRLFSFASHKKWVYWFDRFNAKSRKSRFMTVPTGRNHYFRETLPVEVFLPPREVSFEGEKAYVPTGYDQYLGHLYGDYMKLPPEEKRERHFIVDFKL